jgi:hypothetical protein
MTSLAANDAAEIIHSPGGWKGNPITCLGAFRTNDGSFLTQASLNSVAYSVYDLNSATPDTAVADGTVTISDCVFDSFQTGPMWTVDDEGYNFAHRIPGTAFGSGDHAYKIVYLFTQTDGSTFVREYRHWVKAL